MISTEKINEILNIRESYELPERLMKVLLSEEREEIFEKFLKIESDLSKDFFTNYFQEEQSNRSSLMQDFTPPELCTLVSKLEKGQLIADICAGTGGLTIAAWNENKESTFYCEELSGRAFPILLFNLSIRKINAIAVRKDILEDKIFESYKVEDGEVTKIEQIEVDKVDLAISNPPYSAKWNERKNKIFDEYGYPPRQYADYAFVLYGFSMLKENGKMMYILPHGVLFRGSKEAAIRKSIIQQKKLDAVIGLPEKLFLKTQIPVCICVFGKSEEVLFIDASKEFDKDGKQNKLKNLDKIIEAYQKRKETEGYSHKADVKELEKNEYNLNIPRYVDTFEPEEELDILEIVEDLAQTQKEIEKTEQELLKLMSELTSTDIRERKKITTAVNKLKEVWSKNGYECQESETDRHSRC